MDLSKKNFPIALALMNEDFDKLAPSDQYKLKLNKESGLYNYDEGDDTNFWRALKINILRQRNPCIFRAYFLKTETN